MSRCEPCEGQFISSYFLVNKSLGDKRFILNLKLLNEFITPPHFKMENVKTALRLITKNCYLASIDLKDAYLLIPIADEFKKYLRFSFEGKLFEFNCLPFGLCTAPYVFTKLLKPVVHHLRSVGLTSVAYLDDFLLIAKSESECLDNVRSTQATLESLGFILNCDKCQLTPSRQCKFLGFVLNSEDFCISLPQKKREAILSMAQRFRSRNACKIRDLAQFIGTLVAAAPAVAYGLLYTKGLERAKFIALTESGGNFDSKMTLESSLKPDLDWWIRNIMITTNLIKQNKYEMEIFTDASLTGWGAYCNKKKSHGWWSLEERSHHINFLELTAAFYGLKCFAHSCEILLRIDNTTAISYINRMGSVQYPKLSKLCKEIWEWCEARHIWIFRHILSQPTTQRQIKNLGHYREKPNGN